MTIWKFTWHDGGSLKSYSAQGSLEYAISLAQLRGCYGYNLLSIERVSEVVQ